MNELLDCHRFPGIKVSTELQPAAELGFRVELNLCSVTTCTRSNNYQTVNVYSQLGSLIRVIPKIVTDCYPLTALYGVLIDIEVTIC